MSNNGVINGSYYIKPKTLTLSTSTVKIADKTYDATNVVSPDLITVPTLEGVIEGDDVYLEVCSTPTTSDVNVGDNKTVSNLKLCLAGEKAGNYVLDEKGSTEITITNATVNVVPKEIVVDCDQITPKTKVYDGKDTFSNDDFIWPDIKLCGNDKLTLQVVNSRVSTGNANVGTYKTSVDFYFTGDNQIKKNYGVSKKPFLTCDLDLTITKRKITKMTYNLAPSNHVYDCSNDARKDLTLTNVKFYYTDDNGKYQSISDKNLTLEISQATLRNKDVNNGTIADIVLSLSGSTSSNYELALTEDISKTTRNLKVTARPLTLNGKPATINHTYDRSTALSESEVDLSKVYLSDFAASCDNPKVQFVSATLSQKDVTDRCGTSVGSATADVTVKFAGITMSNYSLDNLNADGTYTFKGVESHITPRTVTIDASGTTIATKTYDGKTTVSPDLVTYKATVNGVLSGDDVTAEMDKTATIKQSSKNIGTYTVNITSKLSGADANNYALSNCASTYTSTAQLRVDPKNVSPTGDIIVDSYPYTCDGKLDATKSLKLPDKKTYACTNDAGEYDDFYYEAQDVAFWYDSSSKTYKVQATLTKRGNDNGNYTLSPNQFTEDITITAKTDVSVNTTPVQSVNITHVYDCNLDVTKDYAGDKKLTITGLCPINGKTPDVYYQFESATMTDNANVGTGHKTKLVFKLAGSDLSKIDKSLYGLADQLEFTDGIATTVTAATVSTKFDLPERLYHAYDGKAAFTTSEMNGIPQTVAVSGMPCGSLNYTRQTVTLNKSDVCTDAVATVTYKISTTDATLLKNLGLSDAVTVVKTIPTTITPKEIEVIVTMPNCHEYDGSTTITEAELSASLSGLIAADNGKVSPVYVNAKISDANVGTGRTVTATYKISGDKAGNYTLKNNGVVTLTGKEVCAKELEVQGTIAFSDHTYDCSTDVSKDIKSYPYVTINGKQVNLTLVSATADNKNVGTRNVATAFKLDGYSNYKIKGVAAGGQYTPTTKPTINIVKRHLKLSGTATGSAHTYNCSGTYNGTISNVPTLTNISCGEDVSVKVSKTEFTNGYTVGTKQLKVSYELKGLANVISNYILDDPSQNINVTVNKATLTYKTPTFSKNLSHKYDCKNLTDVKNEFNAAYPNNSKIEVTGECEGDLYYTLTSVTITDSDKTPGNNRATTATYKLNNTNSTFLANYTEILSEITVGLKTNITNPDPAKVNVESAYTADHTYKCSDDGNVFNEYNAKYPTISISGVCEATPRYILKSATITAGDKTPGDGLATKLEYELDPSITGYDPSDYGLKQTYTITTALTNVKPLSATYTKPSFETVHHQYNCPKDEGDVLSDYKKYETMTVNGACDGVYYKLTSAKISSTVVPGNTYDTELTYTLQLPTGFVSTDFGLPETVTYTTKTTVTKPAQATFSKPTFTAVEHKYVCDDKGVVTNEFKNSAFKEITVTGICGKTGKYVLRSAQINGNDFTPNDSRATTVIYDLVMPTGIDNPSYYGLSETLTYSDAITKVTNPDKAKITELSPYGPVDHTYECNEDGEVTNEFKGKYATLAVSNVCVTGVQYELTKAQIDGSDFTPKNGRATTLTYSLTYPTGFNYGIFGLEKTITRSGTTNVLKPAKGTYTAPTKPTVTRNFDCSFAGDATADFQKVAAYASFAVDNVCVSGVKYTLASAKVQGGDYTPAENIPTKLTYTLDVSGAPKGFDPNIYQLPATLEVDGYVTINKVPAKVTEPNFAQAVDHAFECTEDGNVTTEYQSSSYNELKVTDICGNKVYYKVISAKVTDADLTPGNNKTTTVVYDLVMPNGYDRNDFGLEQTLTYTNAKTNFLFPTAAKFDKPTGTLTVPFDCDQTTDVTAKYQASTYNKITVSGVCNQTVYYEVESATITGDITKYGQNLATTVVYTLKGMDSRDPADFGLSTSLTLKSELTTNLTAPTNATFTEPVFTTVSVDFACTQSKDVTKEYQSSKFNKIEVSGVCNQTVYYQVKSATMTGDYSNPAENIATQVVYELVGMGTRKASDFGLKETLTYNIDNTTIKQPTTKATVNYPASYSAVDHQYSCGETGVVTSEFQNSAYKTISVTGVCDEKPYYSVTEAHVTEADLTPGDNKATSVTYQLQGMGKRKAADFGLSETITVTDAKTNILPLKANYTKPSNLTAEHQYNCEGESGVVTADYSANERVSVSNACGDTYYKLTSAKISASPIEPGNTYETLLTYELQIPTGYVAADFSLEESFTVKASTKITNPDLATYNKKPTFDAVEHQYVCNDKGDVTKEFKASNYAEITITGICGKTGKYVLTNAQINGDVFTPADSRLTTVTYKLQMPEGVTTPGSYYGLDDEISFNYAITKVTDPEAPVIADPNFGAVSHTYVCNDKGVVTTEYEPYKTLKVSNVCVDGIVYELSSAQIDGNDFTPSVTPRATTVTYKLNTSAVSGFDADLFNLKETISYPWTTTVVKPAKGTFTAPENATAERNYDCNFTSGIVTENFTANYGSFDVENVCVTGVKYVLQSATLQTKDYTPAENIPTKLLYKLDAPADFNASIYQLDATIEVDAKTTIKPVKPTITAPAFTTVEHKYVCNETGDVTFEYKASDFNKIEVTVCDKTATYTVKSATVTADDKTPATDLPTSVVYELSMPAGYDAADFDLDATISFDNAKTTITPASAKFTEPTIATVTHKYDCANDKGDVTNDYTSQSFSKIAVSDVCVEGVYYEVTKAELADKSVLTPQTGVKTNITYTLRYPEGFNPDDFGLKNGLTYTGTTDIVAPTDGVSYPEPKFPVVHHKLICDEFGVVTSEYKAVESINKLTVSGVCRDDVYYEIESAQIQGTEFEADEKVELPTTVVYRIKPSGFNFADFGLAETLTYTTEPKTIIDEPDQVKFTAPTFEIVQHQFECGDNGIVTTDYAKYEKLTVDAICDHNIYYQLNKAEIQGEDFTPAAELDTKLYYTIVLDKEDFNYKAYGLAEKLELDAKTTVLAKSVTVTDPTFADVHHKYACGDKGDVTADYEDYKTISITGTCDTNDQYELKSAKIEQDDVTPTNEGLKTTLTYKLKLADGYVASDFGLTDEKTYTVYTTFIDEPDAATFTEPKFSVVKHEYVCGTNDADNNNVTADYAKIDDYNKIVISGTCCTDGAYYELKSATITEGDGTPAGNLATTLVYTLVMGADCGDAADFGLKSELTIEGKATTEITKPKAAEYEKNPSFDTVKHQYVCDETGNVLSDFQKYNNGAYKTIKIEGVCNMPDLTYNLTGAQVKGSDFLPSETAKTTELTYTLSTTEGYDREDYELPETLTFDAYTLITKPDGATVEDKTFNTVSHQYTCSDNGDVTEDYKVDYEKLKVNGVCDIELYYVLESATLQTSDYTPAKGVKTQLKYKVTMPEGYRLDDYGLDEFYYVNDVKTDINPMTGTFDDPTFAEIRHTYACSDEGNVKADYDVNYKSISISGTCNADDHYELYSAVINQKDVTPSKEAMSVTLTYIVKLADPYIASDFKLDSVKTYVVDNFYVDQPAAATFTEPSFEKVIEHQYECNVDNNNVTNEFAAEADYNKITISGTCCSGEDSPYYELFSATVTEGDGTPADNLATTLVYKLHMDEKCGDPSDFGLASELTITGKAKTKITKPDAPTYEKNPTFDTVEHQYVCNETGNVLSDFQKYNSGAYNTIAITGVCNMPNLTYTLTGAQVTGTQPSDFLPSETAKETKLTYTLSTTEGYDRTDYDLKETITFTAYTKITTPDKATVEDKTFNTVNHQYTCSDNGDVTEDYKVDYEKIKVNGVCDIELYYVLQSAILQTEDYTPATGVKTKATYKIKMPEGYRLEDYGLKEEIYYDDLKTDVLPMTGSFTDPEFKDVHHTYSCDDNGNVKDDYSAYASIAITGTCNESDHYELDSAEIDQEDVTPSEEALTTTLTYIIKLANPYIASDFQMDSVKTYTVKTYVDKPAQATFDLPDYKAVDHKYVCDETGNVYKEYSAIDEYNKIPVSGTCCKDSTYYLLASAYVTADDKTPENGLATELVYELHMGEGCGDANDFGLASTITISDKATTNITNPDAAKVNDPTIETVTHKLDCDLSSRVTADYSDKYGTVTIDDVCGNNVYYALDSAIIDGEMTPRTGVKTTLYYHLVYPESFNPDDFGLDKTKEYEGTTDIVKPESASFKAPTFPVAVEHDFRCDDEDGNVTTEFQDSDYNRITVSGICDADVYYEIDSARVNGDDFTPAENLSTTVYYSLVIPSKYKASDYGLEEHISFDYAKTDINKPAAATFTEPTFDETVSHDFDCDDDGDVSDEYKKSKYAEIEVTGICGKTAKYVISSAKITDTSDLTPAADLPTTVVYTIAMPEGYDNPDDFGLKDSLTYYTAKTTIEFPDTAEYKIPAYEAVNHQYVCNEDGDVTREYAAVPEYKTIAITGTCCEGENAPYYELSSATVVAEDKTPANGLATTLTYHLVMSSDCGDPSDFGLKNELVVKGKAITNITKPDEAVFDKEKTFDVVDHQYQCNETGNVLSDFKAYNGGAYATIKVTGVCNNPDLTYNLVRAQIDGDDFLPSTEPKATTLKYELSTTENFDPADYNLTDSIFFSAQTLVKKPDGATVVYPDYMIVSHKYTCSDNGIVTEDYVNAKYDTLKINGVCELNLFYVLQEAKLQTEDYTPADSITTKLTYKINTKEGYRLEDYNLNEYIEIDTLLTNVTNADAATFDNPDFEPQDYTYQCGDKGDVTSAYSKYASITVLNTCDPSAHYELVSAKIDQEDVTPAEGLMTTLKYQLVMAEPCVASDFQLQDSIFYYNVVTNIKKPGTASFDEPELPAITHAYNCSGDVADDYTGVKTIPVNGICDVEDGTLYYEFTSADIIGDDNTPSDVAYDTKVVYTLKGVPTGLDITDYDLEKELVYETVKTTVVPNSATINCHADVALTHTYDCSADLITSDFPAEILNIELPDGLLCGGLTAHYELTSGKIDEGESYAVGENRKTTLTYTLSGLTDDELGYFTLDREITCDATTEVKAASIGVPEPTVPDRISHTYDCSNDVKDDYIAAGGSETVTPTGICGFTDADVHYEIETVVIVDESGNNLPSLDLYKTVVTYKLVGMAPEEAALYNLPTTFTRDTYTEVKAATLTYKCPADLAEVIKHTYNGGTDITADYTGEKTMVINACSKEEGSVVYTLTNITINPDDGASVGTEKKATATFTLSGLTEQEKLYYTLSDNVTCETSAEVTPGTLSLQADGKIAGRVYNGSVYLDASLVSAPTLTYTGADGTLTELPSGALSVVKAWMDDKNVGEGKSASVTFKLVDDYARDLRFGNGDTIATFVISGFDITKLLIELDGTPTIADKVNDGTTAIPADLITMPNITNIQKDDDENDDDLFLTYDAENSFINEFDTQVGAHTATVTLGISGVDSGNYELSPNSWNNLNMNVTPVGLSLDGEFTTTEVRIYDAKKALDIDQITVPGLLNPDGTAVDPEVAKVVITKAEMITKDAGEAKETIITYEISNKNFAFNGGVTEGTYTALAIDNAKREVILTPTDPIFPTSKTYDCNSNLEMRGTPVIDNVQTNEEGTYDELSYDVVDSSIDDPNVGARVGTFEIELTGADKDNYYLSQSLWNADIDVNPATLTFDETNVKLDSVIYDCSADVFDEFEDPKAVMTVTDGLTECDADAYLELVSAELNSADAGERKTTLTFTLVGADGRNYGLTAADTVKVVDTKVKPAKLVIEADIVIDSIAYNGSTDVTKEVEATGQAPVIISGLTECDKDAKFIIHKAELDDPTPGDNRTIKIIYTIDGGNGKNYGLEETDTVYVIPTKVTPKQVNLVGDPMAPTHLYNADTDVKDDFMAGTTPLIDGRVSTDDVTVELISATLDDPNVGDRTSTLVFKLTGTDAWKYTIGAEQADSVVYTVSTTVTPRTITFNNDGSIEPRGFDGTVDIPADLVTLPTLNGVLDPDVDFVSLEFVSCKLDSANVGTHFATLTFKLAGDKAYDYLLVPDSTYIMTEVLDTRTPVTITGVITIDDRVYDTTTDIEPSYINLPVITGLNPEDEGKVELKVEVAYYDAPDAGERIATIVVSLAGEKGGFYKLDNDTIYATASILPKTVKLDGQIVIDSRRNTGSLKVDTALVHVPGLIGVYNVDTAYVQLVAIAATLDSAKVGERQVSVSLVLTGDQAHNYELVENPVITTMILKPGNARDEKVGSVYYALDGRYMGKGDDVKFFPSGVYIKVTGRHSERIIIR